VSAPVPWESVDRTRPEAVTVTTARDLLGDADVWAAALPEPQELPANVVAEGHTIPIARVQAMHEGKRRKRAEREAAGED
jgi:bifunctional non-homologous end joining protein LigD